MDSDIGKNRSHDNQQVHTSDQPDVKRAYLFQSRCHLTRVRVHHLPECTHDSSHLLENDEGSVSNIASGIYSTEDLNHNGTDGASRWDKGTRAGSTLYYTLDAGGGGGGREKVEEEELAVKPRCSLTHSFW